MFVLTGDWYRIIQPVPNDERLTQRRASAARLVATWEKADILTALDAVEFVLDLVSGNPPGNGPVPTMDVVLNAMIEDQPSLDRVAVGSLLDPRICAAIAIGEILSRGATTSSARRTGAEAAFAGALASALRYRDLALLGHAGQMLARLLDLAEGLLDGLDQRRRDRRDGPMKRFERASVSEDVDLKKVVKDLVSGLNEEMLKDREELQALWWVFGQHSYKAGCAFDRLSSGDAALLAGMELAELVEPPPAKGIAALAGRVVATSRPAASLTAPDLLETVSHKVWSGIMQTGATVDLVRGHALLFPVHHVALRVKKVAGTGPVDLPADSPVLGLVLIGKASDLAKQAYTECAMLRSARGGRTC